MFSNTETTLQHKDNPLAQWPALQTLAKSEYWSALCLLSHLPLSSSVVILLPNFTPLHKIKNAMPLA
jgi:hypothetical protein